MADKTTPALQLQMTGKANSLANKCLRFFTREKPNSEINPQHESPLFTQLPQELRDKIWEFALAPPTCHDPRPVHFHIYDEVYDACTYQEPSDYDSKLRAGLRRKQTHIALLLSCRRIYHEALQYLYDQSNFTFVVFAGKPRQFCSKKHHDRCKSLGRIQDCEQLFRRIRNLTLIIQPGKNPQIDLYTYRLQELLSALGYGGSLQELTLIFNWRLEIVIHDPEQVRRARILKALYPLQADLAPKIAARKCNLTIFSWTAEQVTEAIDDGGEGKYIQLLRALGGLDRERYDIGDEPKDKRHCIDSPKCKIVSWSPSSKTDRKACVEYGADMCCLERGAFGEDNYALKQMQPVTRTPMNIPLVPSGYVSKEEFEMCMYVAVYLMLSPITLPITAYGLIKRKKMKGEW